MEKRVLLTVGIMIIFFIVAVSLLPIIGFVTFQPNATTGNDTYIRQNSDTNYNSQAVLQIGKTGLGVELRSLIEINVSSIPSGNTVISGILQVNMSTSSNANDVTVKVYRITSEWNTSQVGWNNRTSTNTWSSAGVDYSAEELDSVVLNDTLGWYNFTITAAARGWVNSTYTNYGIILISSGASDGDFKELHSSNGASAAAAPKLIIEHTTNAAPSIVNISIDSNASVPTTVEQNVTFNMTWSDLEAGQVNMTVCSTSSITLAGCGGTELCSTSPSSTTIINCSYTVLASDNRTTSVWLAACDSSNCTVSGQNYFYANHLPLVTLFDPNGGETINQSLGNYTIMFNVSDGDSDSLNISIYYGESQNATTNSIIAGLNYASNCNDADSNTSTTNNCTYLWNSTGVYGNYSITVVANDSYATGLDSSDSNVSIYSITDSNPPNITSQWIDSNIYSGAQVYVYANVSDSNINNVWVTINTTPETNITLTNTADVTYRGMWTASQSANKYEFKAYADDRVGNLNDSLSWQGFTVHSPNATTQNNSAPSISLPQHAIKITGQLNATGNLTGVYAYLNMPSSFTLHNNYTQNISLGNISASETKTATWFVSTPLSEATYTLNISYTDTYSNTWNSSNFNIQVTSSVGGNMATVSGYPEVQTSGTYYVEAYFTSGGVYTNADSATVRIYDAGGSLTVGPAAMTSDETGIYNYSYTVGGSATEGQWETRVNLTKNSISYYAREFWKVVGGPFDVRDITIINSQVGSLNISVISENTGGADKDLTMNWNLTREDTGANIISESETRNVPANSELTWYVSPDTSYVGQVRITFLGYYSSTESAGAYKIFTTTSGGGGDVGPGGGGPGGGVGVTPTVTDFDILNFVSVINLTKNIKKNVSLDVSNIGDENLTDISLTLDGLDDGYYTVTPSSPVELLEPGEQVSFVVTLLITDYTGEIKFNYIVASNELTKEEPATLNVLSMKDFFLQELQRLRIDIGILKERVAGSDFEDDAAVCEFIVDTIETDIDEENFLNVLYNIDEADTCIENVDKAWDDSQAGIIIIPIDWTTILIIVLVVAGLVVVIVAHRKRSTLYWLKYKVKRIFLGKKRGIEPERREEREIERYMSRGKDSFETKLKRIREKLKKKKKD
jgi:hypothetical protein